MKELQIFKNEELGLQVRTMLNPDGSISVNAEDTAIGYGWVQKKNGKMYVRWETMNGYCKELGFSQEVGKDDCVPESLFYMLGFKAGNERALKYQQWLAMDVLPSLRRTGSYEMPKKEKQKKAKQFSLSSVNATAKIVKETYKDAGVDPMFIAVALSDIYKNGAGIDFGIPLVVDKEDMPKLYDCTEIAKELGIMSTGGLPHNKAVSAVIKKLHIEESEIVTTPFSRNGHSDVTVQFKPSVLEDVKLWLAENNYPKKIPYVGSKGSQSFYKVVYRDEV